MIEDTASIEGLCLLRNKNAQAGWGEREGPLVTEYLEQGFKPIGKWGEYELLRREGPGQAEPVTTWVVTPVYSDTASFLILRDRLLEVLAADARGGTRPGALRRHRRHRRPGPRRSRRSGELGDVTVLQPPFNLGHQRGLVYALRKMLPRIADDDAVVTMDADGEDRPEDLPRLLAALRRRDAGPTRGWSWPCGPNATSRSPSRSSTAASDVLFRALTGATVRTGNYAVMPGSGGEAGAAAPDLRPRLLLGDPRPRHAGRVRPLRTRPPLPGRVENDLRQAGDARPADADAVHRPDRDPRPRRLRPLRRGRRRPRRRGRLS